MSILQSGLDWENAGLRNRVPTRLVNGRLGMIGDRPTRPSPPSPRGTRAVQGVNAPPKPVDGAARQIDAPVANPLEPASRV